MQGGAGISPRSQTPPAGAMPAAFWAGLVGTSTWALDLIHHRCYARSHGVEKACLESLPRTNIVGN